MPRGLKGLFEAFARLFHRGEEYEEAADPSEFNFILFALENTDHDLDPSEINFVRRASRDPLIVAAFESLNTNREKTELQRQAESRIEQVKRINHDAWGILTFQMVDIVHARRCMAFYKFIVSHSENDLVALCAQLGHVGNHASEAELHAWQRRKIAAFRIPEPTPQEDAALHINTLLERNRLANIRLMQEIRKRAMRSDHSSTSFDDAAWNDFLTYLHDHHHADWTSFFKKTAVAYREDEQFVLDAIRAGMGARSNVERLRYFRMVGLA